MSDESSGVLRAATLHGVRWFTLSRIIAESTALVSSIALARLIPPFQFGHAVVALTVVGLAAIMGPAGISAVVVQRRELGRTDLEAVSFITLCAGAVLTIATFVFAHVGA